MVFITSDLLWVTSLLGVQEFAPGTLGTDAFLGEVRTNQSVLLLALPGKKGAELGKAGKTLWEHRNPQLSSFRWHQHLAEGREGCVGVSFSASKQYSKKKMLLKIIF